MPLAQSQWWHSVFGHCLAEFWGFRVDVILPTSGERKSVYTRAPMQMRLCGFSAGEGGSWLISNYELRCQRNPDFGVVPEAFKI